MSVTALESSFDGLERRKQRRPGKRVSKRKDGAGKRKAYSSDLSRGGLPCSQTCTMNGLARNADSSGYDAERR